MRATENTFARIAHLFDVGSLRKPRVLVAGCGSGGGAVSLQLAMSGIRNFVLVDNDILEPENVIRHVCGRKYIGKKKIVALADVLLDRNPEIKLDLVDKDIMSFDGMRDLVEQTDIVILATDNEPTRWLVNEICVKTKTPFCVGRVFTRGIGGEVFAYRPDSGGCLACLETVLERTQFRSGVREMDLVSEEEREKVYGMEIAEIKDSPGLNLDIAFITALHSRFALDSIVRTLEKRPEYFIPINENYVVWGNRPVPPFDKHFQIQRITLSRQTSCKICNYAIAALS